jgi:hypothetical protein
MTCCTGLIAGCEIGFFGDFSVGLLMGFFTGFFAGCLAGRAVGLRAAFDGLPPTGFLFFSFLFTVFLAISLPLATGEAVSCVFKP